MSMISESYQNILLISTRFVCDLLNQSHVVCLLVMPVNRLQVDLLSRNDDADEQTVSGAQSFASLSDP